MSSCLYLQQKVTHMPSTTIGAVFWNKPSRYATRYETPVPAEFRPITPVSMLAPARRMQRSGPRPRPRPRLPRSAWPATWWRCSALRPRGRTRSRQVAEAVVSCSKQRMPEILHIFCQRCRVHSSELQRHRNLNIVYLLLFFLYLWFESKSSANPRAPGAVDGGVGGRPAGRRRP